MVSLFGKSRCYYWSALDREYIVNTCKKVWPSEVSEVLRRAELAVRRTFIFTHRWDMERCETEVSFPDGMNWTYRHNDDIEWMVMLNRARYMSELGQAYWLTNDEKFAQTYIELMNDWMTHNPLTEQELKDSADQDYNVKDTWRKLDSGIRIVNWIKGYICVRESKLWGENEEQLWLEAIKVHGMYLNTAYTSHDLQSNWGFLETNGLFQIAMLYPELSESSNWLDTAVHRLAEMCKVQVFADGMHNEQCSMYHHEVLHCLFESVLLAQMNEFRLPESLSYTLERMYEASLSFVQPDGRQPMMGDSDSTDIRDVLARGAALFRRGDLKKLGYSHLDYEGIWYYGRQGYERYERLQEMTPPFTSITFPHSGYNFMRSNWTHKALYLSFDTGHMDVIHAHGHDDALHVSLFAYGSEFLIDPGRCTYMENESRQYFKESFQHNTIHADGASISNYVDSWRWSDVTQPYDRYWVTEPAYDYAQGSHDGYFRLSDPVLVRRQILFVKPYYWIILDTCRSQEVHDYTLPFHFAEGLVVKTEQDGSVLAMDPKLGTSLTINTIGAMDTTVGSAWVSRNYNEKTPSLKAEFRQRASGLAKFVTVLYPFADQQHLEDSEPVINTLEVFDSRGRVVPSHMATALTIRHGHRVDHVLLSHQGPRGYRFAGQCLTGDVLLVQHNMRLGTCHAHIVKV